mgnify:CR=1 FL=1
MDAATKFFIVLLNLVVFNAGFVLIYISNFKRITKIMLLIAGNAVLVGGTILIFSLFGL